MRKIKLKLFVYSLLAAIQIYAQDGQRTFAGEPPIEAAPSNLDFDYQMKYQRAFEAHLWGIPAAAIYRFRAAAYSDLGYKDNDIITYSGVATPRLEAITANSSTPYITAFGDLRKEPIVLQVPPAGEQGTLYGQVVDAWQFTIADVGPSGLDKGRGGKYLFVPPGYSKTIPPDYIVVKSPNYRIAFAFRSIVGKGKTLKQAFDYAQTLKMYYLSQAKNPPQQRFIDPTATKQTYSTLTFYDERYFQDLYDIVTVEPVRSKDKLMMGMLQTLGIERGKPYKPDDKTKKAMRQGAVDAWAYVQYMFDHLPRENYYWPDRNYVSLLQADKNNAFTFEYDDSIDVFSRAMEYAWCTYMPKELSASPATQYLMAMADKNGNALEPGKLYKLTVPKNMPVKQFWAMTLYNRSTFSFIYTDSERTTLSSYDIAKMIKNTDGTVTIYIGPKAPKGLEANWIPNAGKRPLPCMRFYGPTEELNNKSFKMPDFELVK